MTATETTSRRRKAPSQEASRSGDGAGAGGSRRAEGDATASYDNAKSRRGKKQSAPSHANARATLHHHLLPLPLVLVVLVCSGLHWIASFRDVMATGKPILDTLGVLWGQDDADAKLLEYTKSTAWFDDSRGWKSKQGGLSTILSVTTDANDMGGLFVRKLAGAAGMALHATKLWPVVFHSPPVFDSNPTSKDRGRWVGASWSAGHFDPVLVLGAIGDVAVGLFYLAGMDELRDAGAGNLGMAFVLASLVEALVLGLYVLGRRMRRETTVATTTNAPAAARGSGSGGYDPEEDPDSLPSRIVARTTFIASSFMLLVSLRDLLLPGTILSFVPRDDIYLEWTGAFLHSPPPDTVEADENGLEAPLYAGDKFVSRLLGLYLSLGCLFKLASAWGWKKGGRGMGVAGSRAENAVRGGVVASRMIWKAQGLGNAMLLGLLRLFAPAARTASLDLRWHLMLVAYEALILREFFDRLVTAGVCRAYLLSRSS